MQKALNAADDSVKRRRRARRGRADTTKASDIGRVLLTPPSPLILTAAKAIVVFSPKSACSNVVVWFLHQLGHYQAAYDYSLWPHDYRSMYYRSRVYKNAVQNEDLSQYSLIRIVRDPFDRAVSSYRHAVHTGYASDNLTMSGKDGFSFKQFIDFLETEDLRTCNPHHAMQSHPVEDLIPTRHFINITSQDLYTRLNEVEADVGLPITNFQDLGWLQDMGRNKGVPRRQDDVDAYEEVLTRKDARWGPWPRTSALLTGEARARLAKLYASDIQRYGSLRPA